MRHVAFLRELSQDATFILNSARLHGYRTDCLVAAVREINGALRNAEWEAND
jgi:hypothetical protein